MAALDDHGDSPYAQDLDGMWHRCRGSSWTPPPADVQCVTECGRRIASVHVSEFDPRLRGLSEDERACEICLPGPPPPNGDSVTTTEPVPAELLELACEVMFGTPPDPSDDRDGMAHVLARLLPAVEKAVRDKVAKEARDAAEMTPPAERAILNWFAERTEAGGGSQ